MLDRLSSAVNSAATTFQITLQVPLKKFHKSSARVLKKLQVSLMNFLETFRLVLQLIFKIKPETFKKEIGPSVGELESLGLEKL